MKEIPLWKQYGFPSEKEFRDRYPESGRSKTKRKTTKRSKGKS